MKTILHRLKDNLKPFHFMDEELQKKASQIGADSFWMLNRKGEQITAKTFDLGMTYYLKDEIYDKFK